MARELTEKARDYLDRRFARNAAGGYFPHQPVYGLDQPSETGQFVRLARTYRLVCWLEALQPQSLLDLGAGEGYIANLVRLRCGCPTLCVDLSHEACLRAAEIYGQPGLAVSLHRLPLRDGCADVVLLSEVFEHLEDPLTALSEALRVARRLLVFTTQELCASRWEQRLRLALRDLLKPHTELNLLTRGDLRRLFRVPIRLEPQYRRTRRRMLTDVPRGQWEGHLHWLAQPTGWRDSEGVLLVVGLDGSLPAPLPRADDAVLWHELMRGPPPAASQTPPWDWLDGVAPPAQGLTLKVVAAAPPQVGLHPALHPRAVQALARRLAPLTKSPSAAAKSWQRFALRAIDCVGFLTCGDSLRTKLRWILRQPLDK